MSKNLLAPVDKGMLPLCKQIKYIILDDGIQTEEGEKYWCSCISEIKVHSIICQICLIMSVL